MLSTDVGVAPAASTLQEGASFAGASRRESGQSPDDFATMFDRCAGASNPDTATQATSRALPKGRTAQTDGVAAAFVGAITQDAVSESEADESPARLATELDSPTDDPGDGAEGVDESVEVIDPRFFVQVCLPVMQKPAPVPSTPPSSENPAPPPATTVNPGASLGAQPGAPGLPMLPRGPLAAFDGLTPRPMSAPAGDATRQRVGRPAADPTAPLEFAGIAVGELDLQGTETPGEDLALNPEEQAAVQDAIERLAVGAAPVMSEQNPSMTGGRDSGPAPAVTAASAGQPSGDPRAIAVAAMRGALSSTPPDGRPPVSTAPAAPSAVAESDPMSEVAAPERVAQPVEVPRGLVQATAAAAQQALPGPHRAASHAARPAGDPAPIPAGTPPVQTMGTEAAGPTPAAVVAEPSVAEASVQQAAEQAMPAKQAIHAAADPKAGPAAELPAEAPAAQARQRVERQEQATPVATSRPTARAAHAIAAFQAVANAAGPSVAAPAAFPAGGSSSALLDTELPTQIVQAIRVQFDNGSGEARVRLNPGFLGGMTVGVKVEGGSVVASLQASSAEVREWMQRNEPVLRQALADQGLHLDRLVIVDEESKPASDDQRGEGQSQQQREQTPSRRPRRPADEGTFELEL